MNLLKKSGKQLIEQRQSLGIERSMEMTREEVIKALIKERKTALHENKQAFDMAIKALEQETVSRETYESEYLARKQAEYELWKIKEQQPSEDCVSRQAVLEKINDWWGITSTSGEPTLCDCIRELPPVAPTRKKGKWILTDDDFVYCSECEDSYYPRPIDASWYYCPHCGAEMESEE